MKKIRFLNIDYSMLSSYLGRSATVLVFSVIVLLAIGALYFKHDDMAHLPISLGICAFDSARSHSTLESLADYVRERGGGDIALRFFTEGDTPSDCDFYLMTSLQYSRAHTEPGLECCCIATVRQKQKYSRGVIVTRPGIDSLALSRASVIFTSPHSTVGYLSPLKALSEAAPQLPNGHRHIAFAGGELDYERVVFGVLFEGYGAGGISLERYQYLLRRGVVSEDELEVILEGDALPAFVLAVDPDIDSLKRRGFQTRLVEICDRMPAALRYDLERLGMSGFATPSENDLELLETLTSYLH
ncbi:MAG: PhnD/SsuA/transferrin family substrate-binding protein [bacterium]|nr:MAG: PhnD/SsuA/transferrin family substrate-binding protein [bacterium]